MPMRKIHIPKEKYEEAAAAYLGGKSLRVSGAGIDCDEQKFKTWLLQNGIPLRKTHRADMGKFQEALDAYKNKETLNSAAKLMNCTGRSFRHLMEKQGIPRRLKGPRKYFFYEGAFESIDTEEQAYWVGFLMADGNVDKELTTVSIRLQERDKGHLEKFRFFLKSSAPITHRSAPAPRERFNGGPSVIFRACSKKLAQDLGKWGVIPNKTLVATPPSLSPDLMRHFWRGMIDGDGGICRNKNRPGMTGGVLYLSGTQCITQAFSDFIQTLLPGCRNTPIKKPHGNVWEVRIGGRKQLSFLIPFFYSNAGVFLTRKQSWVSLFEADHAN